MFSLLLTVSLLASTSLTFETEAPVAANAVAQPGGKAEPKPGPCFPNPLPWDDNDAPRPRPHPKPWKPGPCFPQPHPRPGTPGPGFPRPCPWSGTNADAFMPNSPQPEV
jgi:hypothetical protein